MDTTCRVATEKLVTGVPSGVNLICGSCPMNPMSVTLCNMVNLLAAIV